MNPSSARSQSDIDPKKVVIANNDLACHCVQESPARATLADMGISQWWPAVPSVAATLLAVIFVHQLTKRRDKEKYLYELHSKIVSMADEAAAAAAKGWNSGAGTVRLTAIAETKWRLQLLGAALARLRIISSGWRVRRSFSGPGVVNVEIAMDTPMSEFRQKLTGDPFEDPKRRKRPREAVECEAAKGMFLLALDLKLRNWLSPF